MSGPSSQRREPEAAQPSQEPEPAQPPERPPRVALTAVGDPQSSATWSGVPAGVLGGLRELGVATTPFDLQLRGAAEKLLLAAGAARTRNRFDAEGAGVTSGVRSMLAARRLAAGSFDGVVQIGSGYVLSPGVRYATLEDMTLRQGVDAHPVFSRMSTRAITAWERRRVRVYAGARACCAASHWTAASLREDYGVPPRRVAVVGFGANHLVAPQRRDWERPRFLFVGVDWERKGGPLLLRAFARLRAQVPAATLDLVGGHPRVEQEGVRAHGELSRGRREDRELLAGLFAHATCLVVPSLVEPFGIVYVEAGSSGIPSIASAAGGGRDAIGEDGGIAVAPGDEQALLAAMLTLSDPAAASRMGEAAQRRAQLYTWRKVAERLLRALELWRPGGGALAELL